MHRIQRRIFVSATLALACAASSALAQTAPWPSQPIKLVVGFPAGIAKIPANLTLVKGCDVVGVFYGAAVARDPAGYRQDVAELFELYAAGAIRPHVHAALDLADWREGFAMIERREVVGKVVLKP